MKKKLEEEILMDCKVMLQKFGDMPFDKALPNIQKDLWQIGDRYGITGPEVLNILLTNFPKKENNHE